MDPRIGGVKVWGACSAKNADVVREHGAIPIDYRTEDFVRVVKEADDSLDAVFDPIGGRHFRRSYQLLRRGGRLVAYGQSAALDGPIFPDGRKTGFYGAWSLEKRQPAAYREDLTKVLSLLAVGKIAPRAVTVLPLRDAGQAFHGLERGVKAKIVLDCAGAIPVSTS